MTIGTNHDDRGYQSSAFTLVELLVVIGIIALLMAILLPSLARSKEEARTVICATQLDQIFKATYMYTTDNDEHLPFLAYIDVAGSNPKQWWPTQIAENLGRKLEVFVCPSDPEPYQAHEVVRLEGGRIYMSQRSDPRRFTLDLSYRGACDMVSNGVGRRITNWHDPSHAIMLVEGHIQDNDIPGQGRQCVRYSSHISKVGTDAWKKTRFAYTWERHNGTSHILFLDGGVGRLKPSEVGPLALQQEFESESPQNKRDKPVIAPR